MMHCADSVGLKRKLQERYQLMNCDVIMSQEQEASVGIKLV